MKGLNEFIDDLSKDKKLVAKFKSISDPAEVVKQAKKEGYEFTEDDYMDKQMEAVSGGQIIKIENPTLTCQYKKLFEPSLINLKLIDKSEK